MAIRRHRKYQYESQFQKWGIRKNYSPGFWNSVRHLIRQGGSSSAVKLGGRPVSTRKVKKALARYKPADTDNGEQRIHPRSKHQTCRINPQLVAQDLLSLGLEVARSDVSKPQLIRSRLSFAHMTPSISLMNMFMGCNGQKRVSYWESTAANFVQISVCIVILIKFKTSFPTQSHFSEPDSKKILHANYPSLRSTRRYSNLLRLNPPTSVPKLYFLCPL